MTTTHDPSLLLSRRLMLKIVVTSLTLISGCAAMRSRSELDAAVTDLNSLLNQAGDDNKRNLLTAIARKIELLAGELVGAHADDGASARPFAAVDRSAPSR